MPKMDFLVAACNLNRIRVKLRFHYAGSVGSGMLGAREWVSDGAEVTGPQLQLAGRHLDCKGGMPSYRPVKPVKYGALNRSKW